MIKIEVGPDSVKTITAKASGKQFRTCTAYAYTLDRNGAPSLHPVRVEFFLDASDPSPAPGMYLMAPSSIYVNREGRFGLAPHLVPAPVPSK